MLNKITKGMIAACFLTSTLASAAYAFEPACPTASDVKGAASALDAVIRIDEGNYAVLTAQPAIEKSDLSWMVMAQAQGASSFDPAYDMGGTNVKSVISSVSDSAIEMSGVYVCGYFTSTGGMSVMAVAPQQQDGSSISKTKLKTIMHGYSLKMKK